MVSGKQTIVADLCLRLFCERNSTLSAAFILSTGRSGTRYIASSYYFDGRVCAHHKNPELRLQRVLPDRPDLLEAVPRISRGEQILAAEHTNLRYIESNHHLVSFDVGLPRAFPAACFLYVQRPRSEYIASSLRRGSLRMRL